MAHGRIKNSVVRDSLHGNRIVELFDGVREVLGSKEFQRLRNIRQMGLSSYVFPTAEHSRFSHSLGVYANALSAFQHLKGRAEDFKFEYGYGFEPDDGKAFAIAALCHDVGHTAFSHVLEDIFLPDGYNNHEDCTIALLTEENELTSALNNVKGLDVEAVRLLISGRHPNKALAGMISGALDVDRADYLLRDSQMAGVGYGKFDFNWLIHSIDVEVNNIGSPIVVLDGARGIDSLRQYFAARKHMHKQVYFHPTVRAAQKHLRAILERIRDLAQAGDAPVLPKCFDFLLTKNRPTMEQFVRITDVEVLYLVRSLADDCEDEVLKYLCSEFSARRFPKCISDTGRQMANPNGLAAVDFGGVNLSGAEGSPDLFGVELIRPVEKVIGELRQFLVDKLEKERVPKTVERYLVVSDRASFNSNPPDIKFRFGTELVALEQLDKSNFKSDVHGMFDLFSIDRLYAPSQVSADARTWLSGFLARAAA